MALLIYANNFVAIFSFVHTLYWKQLIKIPNLYALRFSFWAEFCAIDDAIKPKNCNNIFLLLHIFVHNYFVFYATERLST